MSRVIICGGRNFNDEKKMYAVLNTGTVGHIDTVIHGGAAGADRLAHDWAFTYARKVEIFHADWIREGKAAGVLRNQRMLDYGKPDKVVAFPGGRGTADMVKRARAAGIEVYEVDKDESVY